MKKQDELKKEILVLCREDYIGLWVILEEVKGRFEKADSTEQRRRTLEVIRELLDKTLIQAGWPTPDGKGFEPWQLSVDETIRRIDMEWDALGREPNLWEIVWFTTTDADDREVKRVHGET